MWDNPERSSQQGFADQKVEAWRQYGRVLKLLEKRARSLLAASQVAFKGSPCTLA
jgi:hypothetical protein